MASDGKVNPVMKKSIITMKLAVIEEGLRILPGSGIRKPQNKVKRIPKRNQFFLKKLSIIEELYIPQ